LRNKVSIDFGSIRKYFYVSKMQILYFYFQKYFSIRKNKKKCIINFIITSKAEIRVFSPIINYIIEKKLDILVNVFFTNGERFNENLTQKIVQSESVIIRENGSYLLKSFKDINIVNVISLDHLFYLEAHKVGIEIVEFLNRNHAKTLCIQHGGNQEDNIVGQASSKSNYQIVFGKLIFDKLLKYGLNKNKIYLTGNPLHDDLFNKKYLFNNTENKKVISLITCLHTEYDDRANPAKCYEDYIENVLINIDFNKYLLIIKMHPNDSLNPNIYEKIKNKLNLDSTKVKIIESKDKDNSVYDLILNSELIISRSSSIIEEALMIGKKVIAYDLFDDGPSIHYDFLLKYKLYKKVTGYNVNLNKIINDFRLEVIDDKNVLEEIIINTTFKFDGKSSERIIKTIQSISKQKSSK
jgi:CDP-glycerol glycerophosphotransferase (TagB/SpsB family)